MGHEFIGVVEETGAAVEKIKTGDFVIAPFYICDGTCVNCRNGWSVHCPHGGFWGGPVEREAADRADERSPEAST